MEINISSNLIGNSNDKTNFPHKLLSTDTQVSKIRKAFANGSSANLKLSKIQLSKIQSRGILANTTGIMTGLDNFIEFPFKLLISYEKELSNTDTKKINKNNFIYAGLNLIGNKMKKTWLRNNS